MGEVRATAKIRNPVVAGRPVLEIDARVDTGVVMLLLGRDVVERLNLKVTGKAVVVLADDSKQQMNRAGPVYVEIGDRSGHFDCLVGPIGCEPVIGQLVLEALDLITDCNRRQLGPRPNSPAYPSPILLRWCRIGSARSYRLLRRARTGTSKCRFTPAIEFPSPG